MRRAEVINHVLSLFLHPSYLEVGVDQGETFFEIEAAQKVGVDPTFRFDAAARADPQHSFFETTSDAFFGLHNGSRSYDVIYLDGLHTFDQIVRDLINALCVVKPGGVIVIDDVLPSSFHASLPDEAVATRVRQHFDPNSEDFSWMGDVFKVVFFVRDFCAQYSYATVAENHGQLVMWREPRVAASPCPLSTVPQLGFEAVVEHPAAFNRRPMDEIMDRLKRRR